MKNFKKIISMNFKFGCSSPIIIFCIFVFLICVNFSMAKTTKNEKISCQSYLGKSLSNTRDNQWIRKPSGSIGK